MLSGLRFVPRKEICADRKKKEEVHAKEGSKGSKYKHHDKKKSTSKRSHKKSPKIEDDSSGHGEFIRSSRKRKNNARYSDPSSQTDMENEISGGTSDEGVRYDERHHATDARKEAGLEWMVKAPLPLTKEKTETVSSVMVADEQKHEINPKELNPYMKNGGDGYPLENKEVQIGGEGVLRHSSVVGDGGLSWRLKALKRAKEQAEREGRKFDEIVEERWGSLAEMTVSVSARRAAHSHAHLHAIRDRKMSSKDAKLEVEPEEEKSQVVSIHKDGKTSRGKREYLKDVHVRDSRMKQPLANDSLRWSSSKRGFSQSMRPEDAKIVAVAASCLNKFQDDGGFLEKFREKEAHQRGLGDMARRNSHGDKQSGSTDHASEGMPTLSVTSFAVEGMTANQLAAKSLQLRLQGKSKEATELMESAQNLREKDENASAILQARKETRPLQPKHQSIGPSLRSIVGEYGHRSKNNNEGDALMANTIYRNKQYGKHDAVDDEYDYAEEIDIDREHKKAKKGVKNMEGKEETRAMQAHKRIITQEERCQFCFGNPSRPKHLVTSIANTCYLMSPPWEPLVEGHCLIVPMQHAGSTRNVDENVWEELRNYKKCLLRMFATQNKDVIFMETALHLAQQRRHCLVECIPIPSQLAKQAPLYFKKAIDEAEEEWSQHNAKKLIDTSMKGLRGCIPKNFPYFHVEFGLHAGYVHVIDNEKDFKSQFGQDVIIGMLKLPEEEMHRRRKHLSYEQQQKSATMFQKMWDPFDWTKMLD